MSKDQVSRGVDHVVAKLDREYVGLEKEVMSVSGSSGDLVVKNSAGVPALSVGFESGVVSLGGNLVMGSGKVFVGGAPQVLSGAGAVDLVSQTTLLVTTGANALTLANSSNIGQRKRIVMRTDGGDGTLTAATMNGWSSIVFNDAHDWAELEWTSASGWEIVGFSGVSIT